MAGAANQFGNVRYTQDQMEQFIAAHERFHRREPRGKRAVMRFLQAQKLDFSRRTLVEADFTGADFRGAVLFHTDFERAALYCADLRNVDARGANLHRADLRGVSLREANLTGARLDDADMREAILAREDIEKGFTLGGRSTHAGADRAAARSFGVDFTNSSMKGVKLGMAKLKGANFSGALLNGADLRGASLEGAQFEGAVLVGADLTGVRVDSGALAKAVQDPSSGAVRRAEELAQLLAGHTRWIATGGKEGRPALLDVEDLRPLVDAFEGARLTALSAKRACAIGVSFKGAQLQGASFAGADLRDADFTGADLRGSILKGANLSHAKFTDADLRPLPMAAGARAVDLEGATLTAGVFAGAVRA